MPADHTYTVADIAGRYGVTEATILAWVRSGELLAIHVGRSARSRRPTWRITADSLAAFEIARSTTPPVPAAPRGRRQRPPGVVEFYR